MSIKRGEIYYIEAQNKTAAVGSEQQPGRPAIVVSNDKCNESSEVVEIVYLTTQPKTELPTHIEISSAKKPSTALCEQITSVSTGRLGDYIGKCTDNEMMMIDKALSVSLNIDYSKVFKEYTEGIEIKFPTMPVVPIEAVERITSLTAQRDTYREMYESLLDKMIRVV